MSIDRLAQFGIVGLGVMGRNLAWNLHSQNIPTVTYSFSEPERNEVRSASENLRVDATLVEFVANLACPRTVLLMVTAGDAVDQVLAELLVLLEPGDVVMDGGNSFYKDTERRIHQAKTHGIEFLGIGISGGEAGARHGASVMVGGNRGSYEHSRAMFEALAASAEGEPCCGHVGEGGAGHFVKMVHNGIEYGLMQLIAETYDFMHRGLKLEQPQILAWFASQLGGALASYLLEITVGILEKQDDLAAGLLLNQVADQAGQKGTGQWSSMAALEYGVPAPTILAAVTQRQISGLASYRQAFAAGGGGVATISLAGWQRSLADTLLAGMLATFSQGLQLIQVASDTHKWDTDLLAVVRLWRGGCIIRAALLNDILAAAESLRAGLPLLLAPAIKERMGSCLAGWRDVVSSGAASGVPMPAASGTLSYVDSLRSARLPTALIQAQRDCFGAHTFERIDRSGSFHADWLERDS